MSNSNNDEKKGEENNHNLARLVKEIFNSETRFQPIEEDSSSEDQIHDPLKRIIIRTINDLFEFMEPYLMEVLKELLEEERRRNFSQQSTSSS